MGCPALDGTATRRRSVPSAPWTAPKSLLANPAGGAPGAQTTTGGVVVVADTTTVSAPPPPCRTAAWITGCIHRGFTNRLSEQDEIVAVHDLAAELRAEVAAGTAQHRGQLLRVVGHQAARHGGARQ